MFCIKGNFRPSKMVICYCLISDQKVGQRINRITHKMKLIYYVIYLHSMCSIAMFKNVWSGFPFVAGSGLFTCTIKLGKSIRRFVERFQHWIVFPHNCWSKEKEPVKIKSVEPEKNVSWCLCLPCLAYYRYNFATTTESLYQLRKPIAKFNG